MRLTAKYAEGSLGAVSNSLSGPNLHSFGPRSFDDSGQKIDTQFLLTTKSAFRFRIRYSATTTPIGVSKKGPPLLISSCQSSVTTKEGEQDHRRKEHNAHAGKEQDDGNAIQH